ncbi:MAG: ABC transporter ATP-binding protein [Clostridia bacterium]|nr:ABC transporter ATP-binding protein [Clostridia bacterium]
MIKLDGVSKQYIYGARVFAPVDMTINDGEIVALLGDELSGKTTFLKVVAGVTDSEGKVLFDGEPLAKKPDDVIMIFDDLALFANRSCYYNLAYPLKIRGANKDEIDKRVKAAAEKVGITASLYFKARKLDSIDKKRLAIARLFLRDFKVALVDDITRGLKKEDAKTLWQEVAPALQDFAKEGKIVIFATRDKDEAISIADRIVVTHYRQIKQIGTLEQILQNPSNIWAAQAFDEDYAFEKAKLNIADGKLVATTDDGFEIDLSHLTNRVVQSYIGKSVYVGWHSDCYDVQGARQVEVRHSYKTNDGYILVCENCKIKSRLNLARVGTLPLFGKALVFDDTNENSILSYGQ